MSRTREETREFCRAYLRTMDAEQAARACGEADGFGVLAAKPVQEQLEKMRDTAAEQLRREDALRRLAQLAFGRANDAALLAFGGSRAELAELDLSAVSELKVTDKGVEVKFVDRVRALETLCRLLEDSGGQGVAELLQALEDPEEMDHEGREG